MSRFHVLLLAALACCWFTSPSCGNPIPVRDAEGMNRRPKAWLEQPTAELESGLILQFATYGISRGILSADTIDLLERNFDRFAPLLATAQEAPFGVQPSLQRWYRERADQSQSESMRRSLRRWLDSPETWGVALANDQLRRKLLRNRIAAIEALGDWHDRQSLRALRELRTDPTVDRRIVEASIKRIEHPDRGDPFVFDRDGRIKLRWSASDVDSMTVISYDAVTHEPRNWTPDTQARKRLWTVLKEGRTADRSSTGSDFAGDLDVVFKDGRRIEFEREEMNWTLRDRGRLDSEIAMTNEPLADVLVAELIDAGVVPAGPRFVAESVSLEVSPGTVRVLGSYRFEGAAPEGFLSLAYPFPVDPSLGRPHLRSISLRSNMIELPVDADTESLPWHLGLHPGTRRSFDLLVEYEQSVSADSATYVLRSTQEWNRPLRKCSYAVAFDTSLGDPHLNYPFQEARGVTNVRRFYWNTNAFLPDRDLVVRWEPAFRIRPRHRPRQRHIRTQKQRGGPSRRVRPRNSTQQS